MSNLTINKEELQELEEFYGNNDTIRDEVVDLMVSLTQVSGEDSRKVVEDRVYLAYQFYKLFSQSNSL